MTIRPIDRAWFIYVLFDPRDGFVRYVGWTTSPRVRLRDHVKPSRLVGHQARDRWIAKLVSSGLTPTMAVIEVGHGLWAAAERKWIAYFRFFGAELLNHTDGGEGTPGRQHTQATKAAMSAKRKGRKPSALAIQRTVELNTGAKWSPERCLAISAGLKGRPKSPAHRRAISEAAKLRPPVSPETREKKRASMLGKNRDQFHAPERRANSSQRLRTYWTRFSAEERSEMLRKRWQNAKAVRNDAMPGGTGGEG